MRAVSMRPALEKLVAAIIFFLLISAVPATAATIERAWKDKDTPLSAVKVEGDIVPGDASKLLGKVLDIYNSSYGTEDVNTVYLRSKGGDVEEAIKMGAIIRRLRLGTEAPTWDARYPHISAVSPTNSDNWVCASACFLIFAGGVSRHGNLLGLHRPYYSRETASKISDIEYETALKKEMARVREYLLSMEIDSFFIEKLISTSSQDAYVVTLNDTANHHLWDYVPSIEEILLSKCNDLTPQESRTLDTRGGTPEERRINEQILEKHIGFLDCENNALHEIRKAAFDREVETVLMPQCVGLTSQEDRALKIFMDRVDPAKQDRAPDPFAQFGNVASEEEIRLAKKQGKFVICKRNAMNELFSEAYKREADDRRKVWETESRQR